MLALEGCSVELDTGAVHGGGGRRLTERERGLLAYLAERPGQTVSRHALLTELWGFSEQVVSRAADNTVRRLREKIEVDPSEPRHLVTVFGTGYRFIPGGDGAREEAEVVASPPRRRLRLRDRTVDLDRAVVQTRSGSPQPLTANELALLEALVEAGGAAVANDVLARRMGASASRAVNHALYRLRAKLEIQPDAPQHLVTVRGVGTRLQLQQLPPKQTSSFLVAVRLGGSAASWEADIDAQEIVALTRWLEQACEAHEGAWVGDGRLSVFEAAEPAVAFALHALEHGPRPVPLAVACHGGRPLIWRDAVTGRLVVAGPELHRLRDLLRRAPGNSALVDAALWGEVGASTERQAVSFGFDAVQLGGAGDVAQSAKGLPWVGDRYIADETLFEAVRAFVVSPSRAMALVGVAGAGKSRLALEVCARMDHTVRVHHVALGGVRDAEGFLGAVAGSLRIPLVGADPEDQLRAALAARGATLLWLDDLDLAAQAALPIVDAWMVATTDLKVLATARRAPGIRGEHVVEVPPMAPDLATELFLERAALDAGHAEDVGEVVARLDGLPLAIEIAAALAREVALPELALRLSDRRQALQASVGSRHQSMRAALDVSWEVLQPEERDVLAWCSSFRGGFDLAQGEEVLSALATATWSIDVVESLVRHSLVRAQGDRYTLLDSVSDYATERLEEDPEQLARAHAAHGSLFARLGTADAMASHRKGQDDGQLSDLRRAIPNLEVALERAVARSDVELAHGTVVALQHALCVRGPIGSAVAALESAASLRGPRSLELAVLRAYARGLMGANREARADLTVLVEDCEKAGAFGLQAAALFHLGCVVNALEGIRVAQPILERAVELGFRHGWEHAACAAQLELAHYAHGADVLPRLEEVLDLTRTLGERRLELVATRSLAVALTHRGDQDRALLLLRRCLVGLRRSQDLRMECRVLSGFGNALAETDAPEARRYFDEARQLAEEIGDRRQAMSCLAGQGLVSYLDDDCVGARSAYLQALDVAVQIECLPDQTVFLCNLGICEADLGNTEQARTQLTKALSMARAHGPASVQGNICLRLGTLDGTGARQRRAFLDEGALAVREARFSVYLKTLLQLIEVCHELGETQDADAYVQTLKAAIEGASTSLLENVQNDSEYGPLLSRWGP